LEISAIVIEEEEEEEGLFNVSVYGEEYKEEITISETTTPKIIYISSTIKTTAAGAVIGWY